MPYRASSTVETEPATVPLSTVFCADDADVVVRAAGTRDFRVHKVVLSFVSTVFKDMFAIPQPSTKTLDIPCIDVVESAETWENLLRTIYPMPNPVIGGLEDLGSLLLAAKKYEMGYVINSHIKSFESRQFIRQNPLHLYAIACACELEDQAKYVARNTELSAVMRSADAGDLRGLTVGSYHNLISFLTRRDNEWHQTLNQVQTHVTYRCRCSGQIVETLYKKIREDLKAAHFLVEEVYSKALEDRSRSGQVGCTESGCVVTDAGIKAFVERVVKERETLCNRLTPRSLVSGVTVSYSGVLQRPDSTVVHPGSFFNIIIGLLLYGLLFYLIFLLFQLFFF